MGIFDQKNKQQIYETESDRSSVDDMLTSKTKVSELRDIYNKRTVQDDSLSNVSSMNREDHVCEMCNQKNGPFIILGCNHIFHVKCLAEMNFKDIYKFSVIDTEYFESRCCPVCHDNVQTEELMYLHSKFLSSTSKSITKHQNSIEHLENQMKQIKAELRSCYDYKHKLEQEREKSKQIVSILTTMM
jgi:hypothetical protein